MHDVIKWRLLIQTLLAPYLSLLQACLHNQVFCHRCYRCAMYSVSSELQPNSPGLPRQVISELSCEPSAWNTPMRAISEITAWARSPKKRLKWSLSDQDFRRVLFPNSTSWRNCLLKPMSLFPQWGYSSFDSAHASKIEYIFPIQADSDTLMPQKPCGKV